MKEINPAFVFSSRNLLFYHSEMIISRCQYNYPQQGMELVIYTMILASVLFVLYALARRMRVGAFGPAITIAAIMIAFYFF